MQFTSTRIQEVTGGQILQQNGSVFTSCAIDSRKVTPGSLFFALKGTKTDGHMFVADAARAGAAGAVVERQVDTGGLPLTVIQAPDSLRALQDLAASVRAGSKATFIGITGSAGKTSAKEFTASLLAQKFRTYRSEGNLNSITGVPLSLLALEEAECAVFEIGMSEPGEIATITRILRPHVRMLLNVNPVHLGQFASVEAIAEEKCSILQGAEATDRAVFNGDDPRISQHVSTAQIPGFAYGFSESAALRVTERISRGVRGQSATLLWEGVPHPLETELAGKGNLYNIAAAAAAALACGLNWDEILRGIASLRPYAQRGVLIQCAGFDVYDDSYNSNPVALELALDLIRESDGYKRKVAVLGDMLELGTRETQFHADAGMSAALHRIDLLITSGPRSRFLAHAARLAGMMQVFETEDPTAAAAQATELVTEGDLVLVKGSRGSRMETVVEALRNR